MFNTILDQHLDCFAGLKSLAADIEQTGAVLADTIQAGGKILVCGNGGSAADAQHFAAELIGRFEQERDAWPAIALTTDTSILTSIGNDYGFADIFARQVQGLGRQGDALIGISTSGNSKNVMRAVATAKQQQMKTIGLAGGDGGRLKAQVDWSIVIDQPATARVQEAHLFILHFWALLIEQHMQSLT
jgi:D-sedoheptulose 7-phosphate isomerase